MKRTITGVLLVLCLLMSIVQPVLAQPETAAPPPQSEVSASVNEPEEPETATEQTNGIHTKSPATFTTSAQGIALIEEFEGISASSFSSALASAENAVNQFISDNSLTVNQAQFDALVDFTFNLGSSVLSTSYRYAKVLCQGSFTDAQLADAWLTWCHVGSNVNQQLLLRRIRDVKLYIYGDYTGTNCNPNFRYAVYYANGGTMPDGDVFCYATNGTYGSLETPTRSGKYFIGWYTAASGGTKVLNSTQVTQNYTLYARWSDTAPDGDPNETLDTDPVPDPTNLKTTEAGIQFIKDHEGFSQYAYWDISQWTIGYGTRCAEGEYPDGITQEQADKLLREMLPAFEAVVDGVLEKSSIAHTQAQYDALVSFTFNLGGQWAYSRYNIYQYVVNGGYTEMEFVNSMGSWLSSTSSVVNGLARRRIDEANLYLNGEYSLRSNAYVRIVFNGVGGTSDTAYRYYKTGQPLGTLPSATYEGYFFLGWYDKVEGGTRYTESALAQPYGNQTVYAQWIASGLPYADVAPTKWYYDAIVGVTETGLMNGIETTRFDPEGNMTRAMVVTVLHRMAGNTLVTQGTPFTDVEEGRWYSDSVAWAYEIGVAKGITETSFGTNVNITREQLAVMFCRYAVSCGYDVSGGASLSGFADAGSVSPFAVEAMQWAVSRGIINGMDGKLNPKGSATRAQCAAVLMRFANLYL